MANERRASARQGHVFISHASEDAREANLLVDALETRRIPCWIAPRDISAGDDYRESILAAIDVAATMVVLLSRHAATSPHVGREVHRAVGRGGALHIVPVRIEVADLGPGLDYDLGVLQWIEAYAGPFEHYVGKIVDQIASDLPSTHQAGEEHVESSTLVEFLDRLQAGEEHVESSTLVEFLDRLQAGEEHVESSTLWGRYVEFLDHLQAVQDNIQEDPLPPGEVANAVGASTNQPRQEGVEPAGDRCPFAEDEDDLSETDAHTLLRSHGVHGSYASLRRLTRNYGRQPQVLMHLAGVIAQTLGGEAAAAPSRGLLDGSGNRRAPEQ